jgi:hypothetical protein
VIFTGFLIIGGNEMKTWKSVQDMLNDSEVAATLFIETPFAHEDVKKIFWVEAGKKIPEKLNKLRKSVNELGTFFIIN